MAISLQATEAWARMVTDAGSVAYPAGSANGDRAFLWGTWKTFSITISNISGWTPVAAEFADGSVNAGNGTGSVKVVCYFKDVVGVQNDPTVDYSTAPTEGHWVIQVWRKDPSETWDSPEAVATSIGTGNPWATNTPASVAVPDGSVVMALVGFRDDSSIMDRVTNGQGIDNETGAVTWAGDYVESPATHFSSTTGLDMSGDLGHRFVATGDTTALRAQGENSASETGSALFVVQSVTAPAVETSPHRRAPQLVGQAVQRAGSWMRRHDGLFLPERRIWVPRPS